MLVLWITDIPSTDDDKSSFMDIYGLFKNGIITIFIGSTSQLSTAASGAWGSARSTPPAPAAPGFELKVVETPQRCGALRGAAGRCLFFGYDDPLKDNIRCTSSFCLKIVYQIHWPTGQSSFLLVKYKPLGGYTPFSETAIRNTCDENSKAIPSAHGLVDVGGLNWERGETMGIS